MTMEAGMKLERKFVCDGAHRDISIGYFRRLSSAKNG